MIDCFHFSFFKILGGNGKEFIMADGIKRKFMHLFPKMDENDVPKRPPGKTYEETMAEFEANRGKRQVHSMEEWNSVLSVSNNPTGMEGLFCANLPTRETTVLGKKKKLVTGSEVLLEEDPLPPPAPVKLHDENSLWDVYSTMLHDDGLDYVMTMVLSQAMKTRRLLQKDTGREFRPIAYVSTLVVSKYIYEYRKKYFKEPYYVEKKKLWFEEDKNERAAYAQKVLKGMGIVRFRPLKKDEKKDGKHKYVTNQKGQECVVEYPNYDSLAFPIYCQGNPGHWSLLVVYCGAATTDPKIWRNDEKSGFPVRSHTAFSCSNKEEFRISTFIVHYDSLTPHNHDMAYMLVNLLSLVGIVPKGQTKFHEALDNPVQRFGWECGYATCFFLMRLLDIYKDKDSMSPVTPPMLRLREEVHIIDNYWEQLRKSILTELSQRIGTHEHILDLFMTMTKNQMYHEFEDEDHDIWKNINEYMADVAIKNYSEISSQSDEEEVIVSREIKKPRFW